MIPRPNGNGSQNEPKVVVLLVESRTVTHTQENEIFTMSPHGGRKGVRFGGRRASYKMTYEAIIST